MNRMKRFVPGDGQAPPYLAGREAEQAVLREYLGWLQGRETIPGNVVLVGPRGNGKTVLLHWFEREVQATNEVDVTWLTPGNIPDLDTLATRLAPPTWFDSLPDALSVALGPGQVSWKLKEKPVAFSDLLAARCARQPLVVLLDEAHTLAPDVGRELLNASQIVRATAPFLLALAGTPGLREHLNTMSATFWNRGKKLGIGRLTREATCAALTGPAGQPGAALLSLTPEALDEVVTTSQCYPYFIQLWGAALSKQAQEYGPAPLDVDAVAATRAAVVTEQDDYYQDRYAELESGKLLKAAVAVATAFVGRSTLGDRELDQAIAGEPVGLDPPDNVLTARRDLQKLGYTWQAPGRRDWEPGLPSLMDYVRARADVTPEPAPPPPTFS